MSPSVLVIGHPSSMTVVRSAVAPLGIGVVAVPDLVGGMAALGRVDFGAVIVVQPYPRTGPLTIDALFRIARLRHPKLALVVIGRADDPQAPVTEGVLFLPEPRDPRSLGVAIRDEMENAGAFAEPPPTVSGFEEEPGEFDDPTILDPQAPPLFDGVLSEGAGAALLASIFAQELSGRLEIAAGPAAGVLYFVNGEPAAADDHDGDHGLRRRLAARGLVPPDQPLSLDRPLLAELGERGVVSPEALIAFLRDVVRDAARRPHLRR